MTREQLIERFRAIAADRLEHLNNAIVALESDPTDEELAREAAREIHTLKGEARMLGLNVVNIAAHRTEELMTRARAPEFQGHKTLSDLILEGLDVISSAIDGQIGEDEINAFAERAARLEPAAPGTGAHRSAQEGYDRDRGGASSIRVDLARLNKLTEEVGALLLLHAQSVRHLREIKRVSQAMGGLVRDLEVDGEVLDTLESIDNELRLALTNGWETSFENKLTLEHLERNVRDLRLLPLSMLVDRFPRPIRDLAREQGKSVQVLVEGADVEVDKVVLERISEPLLHLVRNAVDHGLETPEQRKAAGKEERGTITLQARRQGTTVEIDVRDDGTGLDYERIRELAIDRGILPKDEAAKFADASLARLLFMPGFSTRERVTDISGRGVGLDVVRRQIEGLNGTVQVRSHPGAGTTFSISVPISVVLTRVAVVRCAGREYALPAEAVRAFIEIESGDVQAAGNGHAARLNEELVPIAHLDELLRVPRTTPRTHGGAAALLEEQGLLLALRVESFVGERQTVQRHFDPFLRRVPMITGTASLEAQGIALLLSVPEVFELAGQLGVSALESRPADEDAPAVLVVDDSEITRDVLVSVLRSVGHRVIEAVDGRDAMERMEAELPRAIVTDLEMPVVDGFGLLRALRSSERHRDIPVIVFSTRGSPEDKRRAADLGADAYLVKSEFREDEMLKTIARFMTA